MIQKDDDDPTQALLMVDTISPELDSNTGKKAVVLVEPMEPRQDSQEDATGTQSFNSRPATANFLPGPNETEFLVDADTSVGMMFLNQ